MSASTLSTRRFSRAGTPSSILSSDSDIRFTRKLGSQYRCGCCVLAAFLLFLLVASVSVYLGSTFLLSELPNDQEFLGMFRVTDGDSFVPDLRKVDSEAFRQRSRIYGDRLNLVFRRSPLQISFIGAEILFFEESENEELMVHFDVRFDARYGGGVELDDVIRVLKREISPDTSRFFHNVTIEPTSLQVQESISAVDRLALQTNSTPTVETEPPQPTTTPRTPRICAPIEFPYCKHLPYNITSYPNFVGHESLQQVHDDIIAFRELVDAECYKHAYDFICQVLQPVCLSGHGAEDAIRPPCRSFCKEFWTGCGPRLPEKLKAVLDCSRFPEYADEGSCRSKPGCIEGLQANALSSRICDGIVDCADFSDEKDCAYCREGHVHCGIGTSCIPRAKRCDGKIDCPNASDERDCLSLAPSIRSLRLRPGDSAHPASYSSEGYVVFDEKGDLGKICTENLNGTMPRVELDSLLHSTANSLCSLLTYRGVKEVEVRLDEEEDVPYVMMQDPRAAEISFVRAACPSKQVMYVRCEQLACGVQAVRSRTGPSGATKSLGKMAGPGDWPWHVALFKEDNHVCDATLISDSWLLTTASCFQGQPKAEWSARLGSTRLSSSSPWQQERLIVGMVKSPVEGSSVVLLKLDRPVNSFSDFIRPVCLPPSSNGLGLIANASQCNTLGWAKNRDLLQRVQLKYNAMEKCENVSIASVNSVCTEAVYPNDDCSEEEVAGSPLLCQLSESDGRGWALLGLASWRIGCSSNSPGMERPRLYDQIAPNLAWIQSKLGQV
ncbi:hypothetical protein QAD02_019948 [Eretmocerus hayati]|uniref:Uncharacterized protein n=1 Tax=Eretmocerus hayati TaxID=131215 RepID=A0ACC2PL17_9HYME|nr:hypothetical protein QAD02_019948 [Eretmocerus hayati]